MRSIKGIIVVVALGLGTSLGCGIDDRSLVTADSGTMRAETSAGDTADASTTRGSCGAPNDSHNCGVCGHDCTALANVTPGASGIECRSGTCFVPGSACV